MARKDTADVIELRIFRCEISPTAWADLKCSHECPSEREAGDLTHTEEWRRQCDYGERVWNAVTTVRGHKKLEKGRAGFSPGNSRGCGAPWTPWLRPPWPTAGRSRLRGGKHLWD